VDAEHRVGGDPSADEPSTSGLASEAQVGEQPPAALAGPESDREHAGATHEAEVEQTAEALEAVNEDDSMGFAVDRETLRKVVARPQHRPVPFAQRVAVQQAMIPPALVLGATLPLIALMGLIADEDSAFSLIGRARLWVIPAWLLLLLFGALMLAGAVGMMFWVRQKQAEETGEATARQSIARRPGV